MTEEVKLSDLFAVAQKNTSRMARAMVFSSLAAVFAVANSVGIGVVAIRGSHENCVSSNEDRTAIVTAVADLEAQADGEPFQIPLSVAEGDPRLEQLMVNVNEVLAGQDDDEGNGRSAASIVEEQLSQRDC